MRKILLSLFLTFLLVDLIGQPVLRPQLNNRGVTSTHNRLEVTADMQVKIMEDKSRSSRSFSTGTNDCGNIGITPQDLAQYEKTSEFIVNYSGFSPEAEAAFQHAVDIWSRIITASVPIEINASFIPLGSGILGSAGPTYVYNNITNEPFPNTYYPSALADQYEGFDQMGPDISASFSSVFTNWYFGLDGCPATNQFDFVTVVLHEIGHGLGVFGSAEVLFLFPAGLLGCYGFESGDTYIPVVYDHFIESSDGSVKVTRDFDPDFCYPSLLNLLQGGDAVFNGPNVVECNGGPAKIYTPSSFEPGSSYSHWDETAFPTGSINALMTPFVAPGEAVHDPGCATALLKDIGYNAHGFIKAIPTLGEWGVVILFLTMFILFVIAAKASWLNTTEDTVS